MSPGSKRAVQTTWQSLAALVTLPGMPIGRPFAVPSNAAARRRLRRRKAAEPEVVAAHIGASAARTAARTGAVFALIGGLLVAAGGGIPVYLTSQSQIAAEDLRTIRDGRQDAYAGFLAAYRSLGNDLDKVKHGGVLCTPRFDLQAQDPSLHSCSDVEAAKTSLNDLRLALSQVEVAGTQEAINAARDGIFAAEGAVIEATPSPAVLLSDGDTLDGNSKLDFDGAIADSQYYYSSFQLAGDKFLRVVRSDLGSSVVPG